jgi:GntR family transcriptional regulator, carbon starvation induced regulator
MAGQTQADQIFDALRADILACRLPPGQKIKINELSLRFDVSLGAVREALQRLSADGLVIMEAQKGFTVSPVSPDELVDLTETRVLIEGLCLEDAIANGDVDWESRIVAAYHKLCRIPERMPDDPNILSPVWSAAHSEFHEALVSGCRSLWLLRIRRMLYAQSERYRHLSVPLRRDERDVASEHKRIMEAVLSRDSAAASKRIREHFTTTAQILLASIRQDELQKQPPEAANQGRTRRVLAAE